MPIQKCSLLNSVKLYSDDIEGGEYVIDSRFAPSLCRSISVESGKEVLWGRAEKEIEYIITHHLRKMLGRYIHLNNVRVQWQSNETSGNDEEEDSQKLRRTDYRAVYLHGRELKAALRLRDAGDSNFSEKCRIETAEAEGSYLVCRKVSIEDWDRIMVGILVRGIPLLNKDP